MKRALVAFAVVLAACGTPPPIAPTMPDIAASLDEESPLSFALSAVEDARKSQHLASPAITRLITIGAIGYRREVGERDVAIGADGTSFMDAITKGLARSRVAIDPAAKRTLAITVVRAATHAWVDRGVTAVFGRDNASPDVPALATIVLRVEVRDGGAVRFHDEVVASASGDSEAQAASFALARVTAALAARLHRFADSEAAATVIERPAAFVVERVAADRAHLERTFYETETGAILRSETVVLEDPAYGAPGASYLAPRTVEGRPLARESYEAFARSLGALYDLRRDDDVRRFTFVGSRK